jgi:hypothetical protein
MAQDEFEDSKFRLQWAKEGLADFERCARIYFKRTPCEHIVEPDPDGIHERHKFKLCKPLPISLTKHTVHIIEDLRAALEMIAVTVARLASLPVDDVHFPFCKTATDFKSRINSCCKGFPEEITRLFGSFEPYGRADNLLCAINELCNTSKHRLIVPVASKVGVNLPYIEGFGGTQPIIIMEGISVSEENEITYAITERGLEWKHHARFSFGIAFGQVGALEGYEVRPNIEAMIHAVAMILDAIEAETRKLGLLKSQWPDPSVIGTR